MEHPDPYHGHGRDPRASKAGEKLIGNSPELAQHREETMKREITEGASWTSFFHTLLRPEGAHGSGQPKSHGSYDMISVPKKTVRIGLADQALGVVKKFLGPPYKVAYQDGIRAGMRMFLESATLSTQVGQDPTKAKLVLGTIIETARGVSGEGSVDTCRLPFDKLNDPNFLLADRQRIRNTVDPMLERLGVSSEDAQMYREFLSFPDASFWKSVGETIKARPAADHSVESVALLSSIGMGSPIEVVYTQHELLVRVSDALFDVAKERYEKTKEEALKTHNEGDAYEIATQDALYEVLLRVAYGIEGVIPDRQLLPRQTMATLVMEVYGRLRAAYPQPLPIGPN